MTKTKKEKAEKVEKKVEISAFDLERMFKRFERDWIEASKAIVRPLPLKLRIPAIIAGAGMISGGVALIVYSLSTSYYILEGGSYRWALSSWHYLGVIIATIIIFIGYMISHKALEGEWL